MISEVAKLWAFIIFHDIIYVCPECSDDRKQGRFCADTKSHLWWCIIYGRYVYLIFIS